jgi:predicted TIM-barrel fold metal-dependent hydrolase
MTASRSAEIRRLLGHPVIDADGHLWEFEPTVVEYLREIAGAEIFERSKRWVQGGLYRWYELTPEQRQRERMTRPPWWGVPTANTRDFATGMLPRLFHERLPELGIDFAIVYPTLGAFHSLAADEEARPLVCRALNTYYADHYRDLADRMTPAALIPMTTPQQAIDELDHAVKVLHLKAIMIPSVMRRPMEATAQELSSLRPELRRQLHWLDSYGLDSPYDYDPFWARCVELGVAVTAHLGGHWGTRTSPSNYMYNHIGLFASAGEAFAKALFMGGVTLRFPRLNFAFLEGGAGWACTLLSDLVSHWEKRNSEGIRQFDPARLDTGALRELAARYGGKLVENKLDRLLDQSLLQGGFAQPAPLDEFAKAGITCKEDIRDHFVPNFFFGCEGDDPANAWAFDTKLNAFGARLNAMFGSDLGHWDVPDMTEVMVEPYEMLEHGMLDAAQFREFAFSNAVRLHGGMNPRFFDGTSVEAEARKILASPR